MCCYILVNFKAVGNVNVPCRMFPYPIPDLLGACGSSHPYPGGFSGTVHQSGRYHGMEDLPFVSRY